MNSYEKQIIRLLLQSQSFVPAKEIASSVGLSRRTIYRYINHLHEKLDDHNIEIISKKGRGFKIVIPENKVITLNHILNNINNMDDYYFRKKLVISYLLYNVEVPRESIEEKLFISTSTFNRLLYEINEDILEWNIKISTNKITKFIGEEICIKKFLLSFIIRNNSWNELISDYGISKERILEIIDQYKFDNNFNKKVLEYAAMIIVLRRQKKIITKLSTVDILFMKEIKEELDYFDSSEVTDVLNGIVNDIIDSSNQFDNLSDEIIEIKNNLMVHIKTLLKRAMLKIEVNNPYLKDIKNKYPIEYNLAGLMMLQLSNYFNYKFSVDEVGYIALYLVTITQKKRKNQNNINTVVVCDNGLSTAFLLKEELNMYFPELNIIKIYSKESLERCQLTNIDIIITTIPLEDDFGCFVVPINQLSLIENIDKVKYRLESIKSLKNDYSSILDKEVNVLKSLSRDNAINEMICNYYSNQQIKYVLKEKLKEREKTSSTALMERIAFPHVLVDGHIESKLFIGVSHNGITWGNKKINLICMAVINKNQLYISEVFRPIYHFASNNYLVDKTIIEETTQYLDEFLRGENNDS